MDNQGSEEILKGLNDEQKRAVQCIEGPVLIVAGAGSGKTRVLTSRVAYLISKGVKPWRILALTFTNKAAKEMKERISLMTDPKSSRAIFMGTFHSIFLRFLRQYAPEIGYSSDFTLHDESDSESLIKRIVKEMQLDDKAYKPRTVLSRISLAKNNLFTPAAYASDESLVKEDYRTKIPGLCDIYARYWEAHEKSSVMDFDDILFYMYILLKKSPSVLEELRGRFDYIMVDEYQDTNYAQYVIMKALAAKTRNICVVGDDSQSIYAFRGAKIENILKFRKDYPESKEFRLEQNYRSTSTIVDAANTLIEKNIHRIPKKCFSMAETGDMIRVTKNTDDKEEARDIVYKILRIVNSDKAQYKDFAILYRTNSQSRVLEEHLRSRNVPYMIYSGRSFYDRQEIKDMMAYCKLISNHRDDESFRRIVNQPARGIGDTSVNALTSLSASGSQSLFDTACNATILETAGIKKGAANALAAFCQMIDALGKRAQEEDAGSVMKAIADSTGLYNLYALDNSTESQDRKKNIEELIAAAEDFVAEQMQANFESARDRGEIPQDQDEIIPGQLPIVTLSQFLENASLMSNVDTPDDDNSEGVSNKVALMTAHSSKGLEFPYVFICGVEDQLFPSGLSILPAEIEEERRLFYVAMTRAQKRLFLSCATSRTRNGQTQYPNVSPFIYDIDSKYLDANFPLDRRPLTTPSIQSAFPYSRKPAGYSGQGLPAVKPAVKPSANVTSPSFSFKPDSPDVFRAGAVVEHNMFGKGLIRSITTGRLGKTATIAFDMVGVKTILLSYAKMRLLK